MTPALVLKHPLRTKLPFGVAPVLPTGTEVILTREWAVLPPGMNCAVIVASGQRYLVFPSELQWAVKRG